MCNCDGKCPCGCHSEEDMKEISLLLDKLSCDMPQHEFEATKARLVRLLANGK